MRSGVVAGILLAAGAGSRYGMAKALIRLDGELLVDRGVRLLAAGGCDPVITVLGAQATQVRAVVGSSGTVVAPDWETGMGASLRAGLAAMPRHVDACVVALADQPLVGATAVMRLRAAWSAGAAAAVATYDGMARNPVLLDRCVWDGVAAAAVGDVGARPWLRAHPDLVVSVPCTDTGSPYDIDTPEDLIALTSKETA